MTAWRRLVAIGLLLAGPALQAQHTLLERVEMPASVAMAYVQSSLDEHGYAVAHEQKCDGGMKMFGFETDYYRVVFFGKLDEVRSLSASHPELTPYLPLKIAVVAERGETLLVALDPSELNAYFDTEPLRSVFERWRNDIRSVFAEVGRAAHQRTQSAVDTR